VVDAEGRVLAVEAFEGIRYPAGHLVGLRINGGHVFG
jgi:sulfate transport system ATP-binding protein